MSISCPFDMSILSFSGSHIDQAQCLLRKVKKHGIVGNAPAVLPPTLRQLLADPQNMPVTRARLAQHLVGAGISEADAGGPLSAGLCRADTNNPAASQARYFVIHDTSSKLAASQDFDPAFINSLQWPANRLANQPSGKTHIYINRLGQTLTDGDYMTPRRATQFELKPHHTLFRGLFLHHELVQPRKGAGHSDAEAPDPGFTPAQYARLALQYVIASVRRGSWMVPAFHCVLDLNVGDHDDPQNFELEQWDAALADLIGTLAGGGVATGGGGGDGAAAGGAVQPSAPVLRSALLAADPVLAEVAVGNRVLRPSTIRAPQGVGPLQDGLNLLADTGQPQLAVPGARPDAGSRGFYGRQTIAAVRALQALHGLPLDDVTGQATLLALDADLLKVETRRAAGADTSLGAPAGRFATPPATARTADGRGGSTTTGLSGQVFHPAPGVDFIDATETLTAVRDGHSLGAAETVRQTRRTENGVTVVTQPNYPWSHRVLPDATLFTNHPGFGGDPAAFRGRATFFGKSDPVDEGTGTGAYGFVQTNSSVFGISLKRQRLLDENLATEDAHHVLHPTERGLGALVEVFFPATRRMVRVPLVDVGPKPSINAVADLTVAATAFLQNLTEDQIRKLDNIEIEARLVVT